MREFDEFLKRQEQKAAELQAAEALRTAEEARERALSMQRRDTRPDDYVPPTSVRELLLRHEQGERYFASAKLQAAELHHHTFEYANFANADLGGAQLIDCHLEYCDLRGANLDRSTIENTSLVNTLVQTVSLRSATLREAHIESAALTNVDFTDTCFDDVELLSCLDLPRSFALAQSFEDITLAGSAFPDLSLRDKRLTGIKFVSCQLPRADFTGADLSEANFFNCDLTDARLDRADVKLASFYATRFTGSTLRNAKSLEEMEWEGCDISGCDLSHLKLRKANFTDVTARRTNFSDCDLEEARFTNATLDNAHFKRARLRQTTWAGARLDSADFEAADLRYITNIAFDQNNLYTAKLLSRGGDQWTELRRQYSGSRLAFHLMILVAFFLPYVIRVSVWMQVNKAQEVHAAALANLQADPDKRAVLEGLGVLAPDLMAITTSRCLARECQEWQVWQLLFARDANFYSLALAWLLIVYNLSRLYLTWKIGPLRDDEDRSYITPAYDDYKMLYAAHSFVQVVFALSVVSLAFHAYDILIADTVWLPK